MKPSLVEWDLTGDEDSCFGAVVFLSATPIRIVKDFDPTYSNGGDHSIERELRRRDASLEPDAHKGGPP
ncbi:MAG: hypothetical protein MUQ32_07020 [Chloroflexi bacterium]|nr:hypothetical protein [Chloroflexota bacterium]